jgi:O-antigen ligase
VMAGIFLGFHQAPSDVLRLHVWQVAYDYLTWTGLGAGTFVNVMFKFDGHMFRNGSMFHPEFAHNDFIQAAFEYGLGAIPLFAVIGASLIQKEAKDWPIFVAFVTLCLFHFPFHCPISAFIGCVVAGHITRDRYLVRDYVRGGRLDRLAWGA